MQANKIKVTTWSKLQYKQVCYDRDKSCASEGLMKYTFLTAVDICEGSHKELVFEWYIGFSTLIKKNSFSRKTRKFKGILNPHPYHVQDIQTHSNSSE